MKQAVLVIFAFTFSQSASAQSAMMGAAKSNSACANLTAEGVQQPLKESDEKIKTLAASCNSGAMCRETRDKLIKAGNQQASLQLLGLNCKAPPPDADPCTDVSSTCGQGLSGRQVIECLDRCERAGQLR